MCKSFGVPELAFLAHRPKANNALAVADDARVPLEVKVQPLVLHIGLRERTLAVQRRLGRHMTAVTAAASAATAASTRNAVIDPVRDAGDISPHREPSHRHDAIVSQRDHRWIALRRRNDRRGAA